MQIILQVKSYVATMTKILQNFKCFLKQVTSRYVWKKLCDIQSKKNQYWEKLNRSFAFFVSCDTTYDLKTRRWSKMLLIWTVSSKIQNEMKWKRKTGKSGDKKKHHSNAADQKMTTIVTTSVLSDVPSCLPFPVKKSNEVSMKVGQTTTAAAAPK